MERYHHYYDKEESRLTSLSTEKIITTKAQDEFASEIKLPLIKDEITDFMINQNHLISVFNEPFKKEVLRELRNFQKVFMEHLKDHKSMKCHVDQEIKDLKLTQLNKIESFYIKELVENINSLHNLINKIQIEIDSFEDRLNTKKEKKDDSSVSKEDDTTLIGF